MDAILALMLLVATIWVALLDDTNVVERILVLMIAINVLRISIINWRVDK
jgi:hypothetical protein